MANTFKAYKASGVTTPTTIISASVPTTIIGLSLAHTGGVGSGTAAVSVKLGSVYVVKDAPIAAGSTLIVGGGEMKIVLETADTLSVESDVSVDVIASVLEIS